MCRKDFAALMSENGIAAASGHPALLTKEWAMRRLTRILWCEQGANAIEYALIASLISVAAIAGMNALGGSVNTMFGNVSNKLG